MFDVAKYEPETNNFTFGRGGNQGARGNDQGGDFFIENVMEELDHPGEFFFDKRTQKLAQACKSKGERSSRSERLR